MNNWPGSGVPCVTVSGSRAIGAAAGAACCCALGCWAGAAPAPRCRAAAGRSAAPRRPARPRVPASARPAPHRPPRGSPPAAPPAARATASSLGNRSSVAVRRVTSISRCGVAGPRSLMRTSTCRPFSRLVRRAMAGSCSVWCAAASAVWSNASPSAVSSGWSDGYTVASPVSSTFVAVARIVPDAAGLIRRAEHVVRIGRRRRPVAGRRQQRQRQSERQPHATTVSPSRPTTSA